MLSIIFVNYRDYSALDRLLLETSPAAARIYVVDNTEPEHRQDSTIARWRSLEGVVVVSADNLGYLGAARRAVVEYPEIMDSDFVAVSNSDLTFNLDDFTEKLGDGSQWSNVGLIAPMLVGPDGEPLPQRHYLEAPRSSKYSKLARIYRKYPLAVGHRLLSDLKHSVMKADTAPPYKKDLFAPHGALMIFSNLYMKHTDVFDFPPFLFCEEVFVGLQNRSANLRCIFLPTLTYSHLGHGSMGRLPSKRIIGYLAEAHSWAARALRDSEAERRASL